MHAFRCRNQSPSWCLNKFVKVLKVKSNLHSVNTTRQRNKEMRLQWASLNTGTSINVRWVVGHLCSETRHWSTGHKWILAKQKLPSIIVTWIILYLCISALIGLVILKFKLRRPTGIRAESEELRLQPCPPHVGLKALWCMECKALLLMFPKLLACCYVTIWPKTCMSNISPIFPLH